MTTPNKYVDMYNNVMGAKAGQSGESFTKANTLQEVFDRTNGTTQQPQQPQAVQAPQYNIQAEINKLKEAQRQQAIAGLTKSRNQQLSNLGAEQAKIQPMYYGLRNQTSTASQQQGKNFSEFLAQRGLSSAGASGQAELSRNVALQGQIGNLNQQEAQANQDISRRMTDVNNAYESDLQAANAGIEAQGLQQLINQMNQDRAYNLQNRQFEYQTGRDNVMDNRYSQDRTDRLKQQDFSNEMAKAQFDFQKEQAAIDQAYRNGQLSLQQAQLELQRSQQAFNQKQAELDNAFRDKQFNADQSYRYTALAKSGSSSNGYSTNTEAKNSLVADFNSLLKNNPGQAGSFLNDRQDEIIRTYGKSMFDQLNKMFWDDEKSYWDAREKEFAAQQGREPWKF